MEPRRETKNEVRDIYSTANPFPTFPDVQKSYSRGIPMVSFAPARYGALTGLHLAPGGAVGAPKDSAEEAIVKERG